jgi:hypothetical protein
MKMLEEALMNPAYASRNGCGPKIDEWKLVVCDRLELFDMERCADQALLDCVSRVERAKIWFWSGGGNPWRIHVDYLKSTAEWNNLVDWADEEIGVGELVLSKIEGSSSECGCQEPALKLKKDA